MSNQKAVTLLEIMLAIGLLIIIATMLFPFFGNIKRSRELNETSNQIIYILRRAQEYSQSLERNDEWIVEFINNEAGRDEVRFYPSSTPSMVEYLYIPEFLTFTTSTVPIHATSTSLWIKFEKLSGRSSYATSTSVGYVEEASTVELASINNPEQKKEIAIAREGRIEIAGGSAGAPPAEPQTITFQEGCTSCSVSSTVPDNSLYEASKTTNYGGATATTLYFWRSGSGYRMHPVLTFDTNPNIPSGATIISATSSIYATSVLNNPYNRIIWACKLTRLNWSETTSNWNVWSTGNSWTNLGGDYTTSTPPCGTATSPTSVPNWINIPVTTVVQDAINNNIDTHILLRFEDELSGPNIYDGFYNNSSENATIDLRPKLTITYQ